MKKKEINLKRANLPQQIVEVLRKQIFTGEFNPGEDLPSERELSEQFGTSRGTMRKALASLAQEGWIEIVHGRGNTVCDFRKTVGIEVLPELILSCPEAVFKPQIMHFIVDSATFIYEQILLAAADNAKPEDKPRLLELMYAQNENLTLAELWDNETRYYSEILRIGDNALLQMSYNLLQKVYTRVIESGIVREFPYPIPLYRLIHERLIDAVCDGDPEKVSELMKSDRKHMIEYYQRFVSKLSENFSETGK